MTDATLLCVEPTGSEYLAARSLGGHRYVVASLPIATRMCNFCDVVQAQPQSGTLLVERVLQRSSWTTVVFARANERISAFADFVRDLDAMGCVVAWRQAGFGAVAIPVLRLQESGELLAAANAAGVIDLVERTDTSASSLARSA